MLPRGQDQDDCDDKQSSVQALKFRGAAYHSRSIRASHTAAPGLNPRYAKIYSLGDFYLFTA